MSMKKGKKTRRVDNIDDFLEKALTKPQPKRASKALVRSDVPKEPAVAEPTNTMIPLSQGEAMFARLEERKRAKERAQELIAPPLAPRLPQRDEEPEEVYEEDFEEEPEPPKKPLRPATPLALKKAQPPPDDSKLRMSVDEINRLVEKDTLEARKREEEENKALEQKLHAQKPTAQMVVQKSAATAPKQLEQKTKKLQERRNAELMEIVQFESLSEGIFDLQSMNQYDEMMRKLQLNEAKNSSTQWNDDYLERECQTNDVEVAEKQVQWPEDLNVGKSAGMGGISRFLKRFLPTIEAVLEENAGGKGRGVKLAGEQSSVKYISSSLTLQLPQDLAAAQYPGLSSSISGVAFFPQRTSLVAVSSVFGAETLIWVWDLQSNRPSKVLRADDVVTSLCIPSNSDYIVVCGTAVGSILLWDLRENGFNHPSIQTGSDTYYLREPTYSTEALVDSGHFGSIERLMELQQTDNRNFQVASLDSAGNLLSWSVIELPNADEAGSELDLGLRISGKMKLIRGSSALISGNLKQKEAECSCLAFDPSNNQ